LKESTRIALKYSIVYYPQYSYVDVILDLWYQAEYALLTH